MTQEKIANEKPRIYHSFRSPYSRLGLHQIKNANIDVDLLLFTGPPDGVKFADPTQNLPKLAYYMLDAPRMTMRMGLPINPPNPFDIDFTMANNTFAAAIIDGCGLQFAIALSDLRWGKGKNISEQAVLEKAANSIDWDTNKIQQAQQNSAVKDILKKFREQIEIDQVFGVPFAIYGASKYWGHDRFDLLIEETSAQ